MITIFAAYRNQDTTEGRGPMVLDRAFANEEDANRYILMQKGVMGRSPEPVHGWSRMGDWTVEPINVMESLEDGEEHQRRMNMASGLAKLTMAERRALGLVAE